MKSVKLKKKRIIALAIVVFFMLLYHEKIINVFDKLTMPDSSELCKIALPSISECSFFGGDKIFLCLFDMIFKIF